MARPAVTGLVLTLNGAKYLDDCLKSLDFCDRLLVVDSGSTDATRDIAERHGATVLVNPWPGPKKQFEFAFAHIETPWVVSLDQDEILSDELRASVMTVLEDTQGMSAFICPRTSFYFDRFLRHSGWYPDLLPRVFRLADTGVHVSGPHYGFEPRGKTRRLTGDIIHYPYENLKQHVDKINYYTQIAAEEMHAKGKRSGVAKALGHGLARFLKIYVFRRGFLDGKAGFVLAVNSFFYAFQKYIRLAELNQKGKKGT
ncbi:glycosyltransferase family 2 protein [Desulfomicrobium salsuginis]